MSDDAREVGRAVKDAGRWITESLDELVAGQWGGGGLADVLRALERIGDGLEMQTLALERIAAALETGREDQ